MLECGGQREETLQDAYGHAFGGASSMPLKVELGLATFRACEKIGFFILCGNFARAACFRYHRHLGQVLVRLRASATLSAPLCRPRRAYLDLPHPPS